MKAIRIFLLVLIIIGVGLLATQKIWIPKLVNKILLSEGVLLTDNSKAEKMSAGINPTVKTAPTLKSISKEEYTPYAYLVMQPITKLKHEECNQFSQLSGYWLEKNCEEKYILAKYPNAARPDEICLEITLKNGSKKKLCDIQIDGPEGMGYAFSDYIPNIGYMFDIQLWEGGYKLLINDQTGEEMRLFGTPIVSPSGGKFLSVSVDLEAGYRPTGFQIWQREGNSWVLKIEKEDRFGVIDPVWVNDNSFYFIKRSVNFDSRGEFGYSNEYAEYSW